MMFSVDESSVNTSSYFIKRRVFHVEGCEHVVGYECEASQLAERRRHGWNMLIISIIQVSER
jgi:hypothetical protein